MLPSARPKYGRREDLIESVNLVVCDVEEFVYTVVVVFIHLNL
jgi:hypothetical protein